MKPWIQDQLESHLLIILKDKPGFVNAVLQVFECLFSFKPLVSHPFLSIETVNTYLNKRYVTIRNYYKLWLKVEPENYHVVDTTDSHKIFNAFISLEDLRKLIGYFV
jgi:hypothetical protein